MYCIQSQALPANEGESLVHFIIHVMSRVLLTVSPAASWRMLACLKLARAKSDLLNILHNTRISWETQFRVVDEKGVDETSSRRKRSTQTRYQLIEICDRGKYTCIYDAQKLLAIVAVITSRLM